MKLLTHYIILVLLLFFSENISAQKTQTDTIVINNLIDKAKKLNNNDSSFIFLNKALILSQKGNYKYKEIKINLHYYNYYFNNGEYNEAEKYINNAIKNYESLNEKEKTHKMYNLLGWLYVYKGEYTKAITYANKALEFKNLSQFQIATSYNTLASAYQYLGNYTDALDFFYKGLKIHEDRKNPIGIAITYNNIASIYTAQSENKKALELYKKATIIFKQNKKKFLIPQTINNIASIYLKEEQYDSAKYYYEISYKLNSENENIVELARVASNMGQLYLETKKYDDSEKFLNEAINIFSKTNNGKDLAICFQQKAHLLFEKGKITDAITEMTKALKFATDAKSNKHKIDIYKHLSKFYLKKDNYKAAYKNLELHTQLKDSIFTIEKTKALKNITSIYEIEKKEQKIILLEKEKEINNFRNYIFIAAIFILLLSLLITIYIFILRNKSSKQKVNFLKEEQRANRLELDKNQLLLEKRELANINLKTELSFKEKELATNAMHIIQTNETNIKIVEELTNIKKSLNPKDNEQHGLIFSLIKNISINKNDDIWKEFEVRFTQVHQNFYNKLNEKYPDLTPNEKKLCAFLKLNMTTKEVSMITHQSPNSIRVARTRLRKKLDITSDENLINFLASIH